MNNGKIAAGLIRERLYNQPLNEDDVCEVLEDLGNFFVTSGVSRIVVGFPELECVIKIPIYNKGGRVAAWTGSEDFCEEEVYLFERAEECGVSHYFLPLEEVGRLFDGTPIYAQEMIDTLDETDSEICEYMHAIEEGKWPDGLDLWGYRIWSATDVFKFLGEHDMMEELESFVEEWSISDMHPGNLGVTSEGQYVILDYAGWYNSY